MKIDLSLRDAQVIRKLIEQYMEKLTPVNDDNYPTRQDDYALLDKLIKAADSYWNK